jgi:hypothetical protein
VSALRTWVEIGWVVVLSFCTLYWAFFLLMVWSKDYGEMFRHWSSNLIVLGVTLVSAGTVAAIGGQR